MSSMMRSKPETGEIYLRAAPPRALAEGPFQGFQVRGGLEIVLSREGEYSVGARIRDRNSALAVFQPQNLLNYQLLDRSFQRKDWKMAQSSLSLLQAESTCCASRMENMSNCYKLCHIKKKG